jgi:hypothetical protein
MTKLIWIDATIKPYVSPAKTPVEYTTEVFGLKVFLKRHFAYSKTDWVLYCNPWFGCLVVSTGTIEEAKESAELVMLTKAMKFVDNFK